jgi:hypothetical protein
MGAKKDKLLQVRVPRELAASAKVKADREDRPLAQIVRELLKAWLSGQGMK